MYEGCLYIQVCICIDLQQSQAKSPISFSKAPVSLDRNTCNAKKYSNKTAQGQHNTSNNTTQQ
jgi:hypothetical protein